MKYVKRELELKTMLEIIDKHREYKENSENGLVILMNGSWGSGKTTFLKDLQKEIVSNENYNFLGTYNPFEYDFYDNAYIPLFATINEKNKMTREIKKIIEITNKQIANQTLAIAYSVTKGLFHKTTGIDIDDIKKLAKNVKREYEKDNDYLKEFQNFDKFKNDIKIKLKTFCEDKPTVFIIDELDRCNPKFAIETIEIVKHFFDIENCIFIIAVDKFQLKESAKTIFGQNMNSDIYFSKFFDYQFNLNKIDFYEIVGDKPIKNFEEIKQESTKLFNCLGISLRDSKKIFNEFCNKYNDWSLTQSMCMILMITLKYTDLTFYNAVMNGDYTKYQTRFTDSHDFEGYKYQRLLNLDVGDKNNIYKIFLSKFTHYLDVEYVNLNVVYEPFYTDMVKNGSTKKTALESLRELIPQKEEGITYMETIKKLID